MTNATLTRVELTDAIVREVCRSFITFVSSNAVKTSPAKTFKNRAFSVAKLLGVALLTTPKRDGVTFVISNVLKFWEMTVVLTNKGCHTHVAYVFIR